MRTIDNEFNYEGRTFCSVESSTGGDVSGETTFSYHQNDRVVWATYAGGAVLFGTLIATADESGQLDMRYQHIARDGFKSALCKSRPECLKDGRIRLHETWQWTDGAMGQGTSVIEEIR